MATTTNCCVTPIIICAQGEEERRPALCRDLMPTCQIASIENRFFRHGCGLAGEQSSEGLEKYSGHARIKMRNKMEERLENINRRHTQVPQIGRRDETEAGGC